MKKLLLIGLAGALTALVIREYRYLSLVKREIAGDGETPLSAREHWEVVSSHIFEAIAPAAYERYERKRELGYTAWLLRLMDQHGALSGLSDEQIDALVQTGEFK